MIAFVRFVACLVHALFRSKLRLSDESRVSFLTLPNDIDANLHMNNGRYLTFMDLGRLDLTMRCGLLRQSLRVGQFPVVGSTMVRFVRSVAHLERFEVTSRILGWDEKWFYFEHRGEVAGRLCAIAWVKGLFRGKGGAIAPAEIVALAGWSESSPELPDALRKWVESEREAFTPKISP